MKILRSGAAFAAPLLFLLSACTHEPVTLSSQFDARQSVHAAQSIAHADANRSDCRVWIAPVHDERDDPQAMGNIAGRPIRADTVAWVGSALNSLGGDSRIHLVGAPPADLSLSVDLLKAYMISMATSKSANVVLRVHYSRSNGAGDTQVYRGTETGVDWSAASAEAQGALDRALAGVIESIDADLTRHCS